MNYAANKIFMTDTEIAEYRRELDVFSETDEKVTANRAKQLKFDIFDNNRGGSTPEGVRREYNSN